MTVSDILTAVISTVVIATTYAELKTTEKRLDKQPDIG